MSRTRRPAEKAGADSLRGIAGLRRQLLRPATLAWAALTAVLCAGLAQLTSFLPDLSRRPEYRVPVDQVRITQPPHWVPHDLVEQVVAHANLPREVSVLDPFVAKEIAEAFALHPWIERVVSVQKAFPAAIDVALEYRRPVAMVALRHGTHPIDRLGILLPGQDFAASAARAYPLVTGVRSTPQGPPGTEWGDPIVADAAAIADLLGPHWKKLAFLRIECPATAARDDSWDDGVYQIVAKGGSKIIWGQPPGSNHPAELDAETKIARLLEYAARYGAFGPDHGPYLIDIRHFQDISRVPLSAAAEARYR
jgi:hypothetical protein